MAHLTASIRNAAVLTIAATGLASGAVATEKHSMNATTAQDLADRAGNALDAGRAAEASGLYDQALAAIGDAYRKPGTLDDTSMKLIMANAEAKKGEWSRAAHLKKSVVEARLALAATPN